MGLLEKINVVWQKIGIVQRAMLVAVIMACVITGGLLMKWASTPKMELLYGNLALEDVDAIINDLREQSVPYELKGGSAIYVPQSKVMELKASLLSKGLPKSGYAGFEELFDNRKSFGDSPKITDINFNRAMQEELARTIEMLDGIALAQVFINRPPETLFTNDAQEATASVTLRLQPGWQISPGTIASITHHVANSTPNLKPENVAVMDTQGRMLTSGIASNSTVQEANTFLDIANRVESGIENDILKFLEPALGPGRASVEVTAEIDMTSQTVQTTKYDKGIPLEETITTTSQVKGGPAGADGSPSTPSSTDKEETTETKNMIPETITTIKEVPGKIVSLSVAVMVDLTRSPEPTAEGEADSGTTTAAAGDKIMSLADVEELIRAAVGPKRLPDVSSLTVKDTLFNRPVIEIDDGPLSAGNISRYIEIARQSSMGVLAICALLALKIFTKASRRVAAEGAVAQGAGAESMGMLPAGQGELGPQMAYRQQITSALQQNPEQVKQLFASWLAEDR